MFRKTLLILTVVMAVGCAERKDIPPTSSERGPRLKDVYCSGTSQFDCILYIKKNISRDNVKRAKLDTEEVANAYAKSLSPGGYYVHTSFEKNGTYRVLCRVFHFPNDAGDFHLSPQE